MMEKISKEKLSEDIRFVLRRLYEEDCLLIKCGANERCLSARFFAYIMDYTKHDDAYVINDDTYVDTGKRLDWDPEYNRKGIEGEPKDMGGGRRLQKIIPDIVLHHRGNDFANICVFEFKRKWRSLKADFEKLAYLTGPAYRYRFGVSIVLLSDRVKLFWFRKGKMDPNSPEIYSTKTWEPLQNSTDEGLRGYS